MRLSIVVALFAIALTSAVAQRSAPVRPSAPARPTLQRPKSPASRFAFGSESVASRRRASPRTSLPFQLLGDSFNFDDLYSGGYPVASQPPAFLLQAVRALGGSEGSSERAEGEREPPSNQPLMIELQGGRYVRVSSTSVGGEALPLNMESPKRAPNFRSQPNQSSRAQVVEAAPPPPRDLAPVTLIFRDGRTEVVSDYTIADGALYARGDFYKDGYWNKKIVLSGLDLNQTLEANQARNVKFVLPSSPNEVITRP
jgi:hypothetical protein